MSARHRARITMFATAAALLTVTVNAPARAQAGKPGDVTASASLTGFTQLDTDLDGGGQFHWGGGLASGSVLRQFTPRFGAGLTVRYDYQDWKFSAPSAFGGVAPWSHLDAPSVGLDLNYAYGPDIHFVLTPTVEWSYESGANTSDALTYGAVASAAKVFSPDLVLGLGVSVFRRINETKALPFFIVNWKINDRWRIANPFKAGPAGGAGLELAYTPDDHWEFGAGGTYRSYRFRLKENGPTPNGIGDNSFFPLFARISRKLTPHLRFDFYAAAVAGGKLSVDYANGDSRYSDDAKLGPGLGATFVYRY